MSEYEPSRNTAAADKTSQSVAPARVTSTELLGSAKEIIIEHQGRDYHLRLTQNGKLILTA